LPTSESLILSYLWCSSPSRHATVSTRLDRQHKDATEPAERHRAGLRVGTALTEGTANFLVNRRMNKAQQMRWSRRGADLLLQVRCAI
jgi:hypothetical protein